MLAIENDLFLNGVIAAYKKFKAEAIEEAIASSTTASWSGSGYSVELFPEGRYRILWDNRIGNKYDSPGVILGISPCSDEDWNDDESIRFYDNAIEHLEDSFKQWKSDYIESLRHRTMTNLNYASFELITSERVKTGAFFVILKHQDGIYSTGLLIDNPEQEDKSGWYLFAEKRFKTEIAAVITFNKLCASVPIKPVKIHG